MQFCLYGSGPDMPINTSTKRAKYLFVEIIIIYIKSGQASVLNVGTSQNAFDT